MKYAQIRQMDISNGLGIGVSLYTQGCPYHCKNCFNPETWDFEAGQEWSQEQEDLVIKLLEPQYIKRLTILGGEPLVERNIKPLERLLQRVRLTYPDKVIWLYTGGLFENESAKHPEIFKYIDVLVDGRFVDELKDLTLAFKGSSNQRIIDVQKSLIYKKVILYDKVK